MWKEFNLINSFTLEASFMGPNKGHSAGLHFSSSQLKQIGQQYCETLVDYVRDQERVKEIYAELKNRYP
jgi:hypothetical protein